MPVLPGLLLLELDAAPLPDMPLPVAPVPELLVPALGAGVGAGAVVDGAGAVGAGAGGGTTTLSSFLLQAVRPTATSAAMRSGRFMVFPLGEHHTV